MQIYSWKNSLKNSLLNESRYGQAQQERVEKNDFSLDMLLNSLSLNTSLACYSVNSQSFIFYYASSFLRLLQKQPALVSSKIFQLKISLNFKTSSQIFSVLDSKGPKEIVQKVEPSSSSRTSQETEQSHPQGKRSQPNESSDKPPPSKKRK